MTLAMTVFAVYVAYLAVIAVFFDQEIDHDFY